MEATNQTEEGGGGDDDNSSSSQIFHILISDFLSPIKPSSATKKFSNTKEDLILQQKLISSGNILLMIVRNALRSHQSEKFRKVRMSNPKIQNMVIAVPYAVDLLTAVGFVYAEMDGEKYLMFSENEHNIATANLFCSTMEEEMKKLEAPSFAVGIHTSPSGTTVKETSSSSTGTDNKKKKSNNDTLEQERKKRVLYAKKVKLAKNVEKNRVIQLWAEDKEERQKRVVIRKLDETASPSTKNPPPTPPADLIIGGEVNESLESLRAKAAETWNIIKQKSNNNDNDSTMNENNGNDKDNDDMEEDDASDLKPAAATSVLESVSQFVPMTLLPETDMRTTWQESLKFIPRCGPAIGIRETSVFNKGLQTHSSSTKSCLKRLFSEFEDLKTSLPSNKLCSAWLRYDDEMPQYIRAILTAPLPGPSPYSGGVFAFDIMIPNGYPNVSPKVQIITTGNGQVRFGPNLYACGKVCLSLLGTWEGPKWNPERSSLFQVLVSIQSLILGVEHPYFLEPGHGGWEEKVKEGDFASTGKTLSGETITEDLTLPSRAWVYEDHIRVASLRHAMLEPLTMVLKKNSMNIALAHLLPFQDIIQLHFYYNRDNINESVVDWINASRPSTIGQRDLASPSQQRERSTQPYPVEFVNSLNSLYRQFEEHLKKLSEMELPSTIINEAGLNQSDTETMRHPSTSVENNNISMETDLLHRRMKEAAQCDNFILAGQIQKEIQESESFDQKVVDLNAQIKEAASNGDYVTAGRLQATLKAHQGKIATAVSGSTSNLLSSSAQQQMYPQDDEEMESVDDQFSDEDSFENGYGNPKLNKWGSGQKLNQLTSPISASKNTPATVSVIRLPVKDSRRLRIRLPTSSIVEEFDSNETLKTVYQVVKIHLDQAKVDTNQRPIQAKVVQLRGLSDELGNQKVGLSGGAFAAPLSEFGFTLLSAIPKREFSLEIDGLKSLKDLNMAKSAALTVMQCNQRGLSRRGALEDKLAEAQGDAMDVDDLNYEALQELGEKMGVAAPGDGVWKGLDQLALGKVSTLLSPKEFLSQKTAGDDDSYRCCICLGEFDPNDAKKSLRLLNHCAHIMHAPCLQTWLSTKTSCPVCKHSLNE